MCWQALRSKQIFESSNTHLCSITLIVSKVSKESCCKSKERNLTSYTLKNKREKHQKLYMKSNWSLNNQSTKLT
jgi:hypothetical protein